MHLWKILGYITLKILLGIIISHLPWRYFIYFSAFTWFYMTISDYFRHKIDQWLRSYRNTDAMYIQPIFLISTGSISVSISVMTTTHIKITWNIYGHLLFNTSFLLILPNSKNMYQIYVLTQLNTLRASVRYIRTSISA